jgi:hypothetical protein
MNNYNILFLKLSSIFDNNEAQIYKKYENINKVYNQLIAINKKLYKYINFEKDDTQKFNIIIQLLIKLLEYFTVIDKNNRSDIKYFQNKYFTTITLYILSLLHIGSNNKSNINYEENEIIYGGYNIFKFNIRNLYNYISRNTNFDNRLILLKNKLKKYIDKLNDTNNLLLITQEFKNKNLKNCNIEKEIYNVNDFIISFLLYYTNINDFNFINTVFSDNDIKHISSISNTNKEMVNIETENGLIHKLYNLIETGKFNCIFDYPDNFILTYNILFKGKHIIYHKELQETSKETDLVLLNFLALFEKHINKLLIKNYISLNIDLKEKIKIIHDYSLNTTRFYDFKFFCELLYCIYYDENIFKNSILQQDAVIINNILEKNNIDNFINCVIFYLTRNNLYHKFTIIYHNKKCKEPCIVFFNKYYNTNYINFKKPYFFVNEMNDMVNYYATIFQNNGDNEMLQISQIHHSFIDEYYKVIPDLYRDSGFMTNERHIESDGLFLRYIVKKLNINYYSEFYDNEQNFLFLPDLTIHNKGVLSYDEVKKIFISYFKNYCLCFDKLKNLVINFSHKVNKNNQSIGHANSIIINFDEKFIDIYNTWGLKYSDNSFYSNKDDNPRYKIMMIYKYVVKFFKNDFKNILDCLNNFYKTNLNINEFVIYDSENNAIFQSTYENKNNGYCRLYSILYPLMRIKYFNNSQISMNYIQELLIEYLISINHYLYVFQILNFLMFSELIEIMINKNINLMTLNIQEFNYNISNTPKNSIKWKYYSFLINKEKCKKNNRNIDRIFNVIKKNENLQQIEFNQTKSDFVILRRDTIKEKINNYKINKDEIKEIIEKINNINAIFKNFDDFNFIYKDIPSCNLDTLKQKLNNNIKQETADDDPNHYMTLDNDNDDPNHYMTLDNDNQDNVNQDNNKDNYFNLQK